MTVNSNIQVSITINCRLTCVLSSVRLSVRLTEVGTRYFFFGPLSAIPLFRNLSPLSAIPIVFQKCPVRYRYSACPL